MLDFRERLVFPHGKHTSALGEPLSQVRQSLDIIGMCYMHRCFKLAPAICVCVLAACSCFAGSGCGDRATGTTASSSPDCPSELRSVAQESSQTKSIPGPARWSRFAYDNASSGFNPAETILNPGNVFGLVVAWKFPTLGKVRSSPAVANGMVYISSSLPG